MLTTTEIARAAAPRPVPTAGGGVPPAPRAAAPDWDAVIADPRFQRLHRRKSSFLWGLMAFSVLFYFLLPVGAAYFQSLFRVRVWGVVNVGLLFALAEFAVAWGVAAYYSRRANREFDQLAAAIAADHVPQSGS